MADSKCWRVAIKAEPAGSRELPGHPVAYAYAETAVVAVELARPTIGSGEVSVREVSRSRVPTGSLLGWEGEEEPMIDTIRNRVFVQLARALGDHEAAGNPEACDLISLGTHDGEEVHLSIQVNVDLLAEAPLDPEDPGVPAETRALEHIDVVDGPPGEGTRRCYRSAHKWAEGIVRDRFLKGYTSALPEPPEVSGVPYPNRKHPLEVRYPGAPETPPADWMPIALADDGAAMELAEHILKSVRTASELGATYAELRVPVALPEWHVMHVHQTERESLLGLAEEWLAEIGAKAHDSVEGEYVAGRAACLLELCGRLGFPDTIAEECRRILSRDDEEEDEEDEDESVETETFVSTKPGDRR